MCYQTNQELLEELYSSDEEDSSIKEIQVRTPRKGRRRSITVSTNQVPNGASKGIARLNYYSKGLKQKGRGPVLMLSNLASIEEEKAPIKPK